PSCILAANYLRFNMTANWASPLTPISRCSCGTSIGATLLVRYISDEECLNFFRHAGYDAPLRRHPQPHGTFADTCRFRKLNPGVSMVQPAQDRLTDNILEPCTTLWNLHLRCCEGLVIEMVRSPRSAQLVTTPIWSSPRTRGRLSPICSIRDGRAKSSKEIRTIAGPSSLRHLR